MAYNTEAERNSTLFLDQTLVFKKKAGGTFSSHRLASLASDGDVEQSTVGSADVIGVLHSNYNGGLTASSGDYVSVGTGRQTCVADGAMTPRQAIKAASSGRVVQFIDSVLAGTTIEDNVGVAFTNQPTNDGLEMVSADAADTTQTATAYYTRTGQGDTVYTETKTINGTTQVSFTDTDIDKVLAVEKSAATAGTITFREASGNATITTLAAGTLSAGKIAVTAGQTKAYNVAPVIVADAATTKQVGLIGTSTAGATQYDSQALTGTTAVAMNSAFNTVTFLLVGDLEVARTVTVKVGAEDNQNLYVGYTLESAAAQGDLVDCWIAPHGLSATDAALLDGITAGVVLGGKAAVPDSNKDIGDFRNLDAVNFDAGASGTAGTLDVFPSTASKGKIQLAAADSAGDTTTTITNASQAGARTYTIPDAGASASFVMTEGAQTVNGAKTFGSQTINTANAGTANTGTTAVEYGDGRNHITVLTVSTTLPAIAGGANLGVGKLLYTMPAGACVIRSAKMSMAITQTQGNITADTPDGGLGSVIASGVVATLDGTATFEDILTGQTFNDCNGTAEVKTVANQPMVMETGAAHTVHFNVADGWAASGDAAAILAGTVILDWAFLG